MAGQCPRTATCDRACRDSFGWSHAETLKLYAASAPAQKKGEPEELNLGVLEKEAIERALRRADGNITRAAELLGITRFALYRKLDKLGL